MSPHVLEGIPLHMVRERLLGRQCGQFTVSGKKRQAGELSDKVRGPYSRRTLEKVLRQQAHTLKDWHGANGQTEGKQEDFWEAFWDFWKMLLKQCLSFNSLKCAADYSRALECQNALQMNLELGREGSCGKKSGGCGQWASPSPVWLFRRKPAGGMRTDDWTTSPSKLDLKLCFPKIALWWGLPLQALGSHPYTSLGLVSLDFPF